MIPYENMEDEDIIKEKSNTNTIQDLSEKISKECPGDYLEIFNNLTKYKPDERCTLSTAITKLRPIYMEVDTGSLNSEQIITEPQFKINQPPQENQQNLD